MPHRHPQLEKAPGGDIAVVVDAGPLIALADPRDPRHDETRRFLEGTSEALPISPFVLAEADHLITEHAGIQAELALLADVVGGSFILEPFDAADIERSRAIVERYRDLDIRLADASVVVLAERYRTRRILTFDERHFRVLRAPGGETFTILPADEAGR